MESKTKKAMYDVRYAKEKLKRIPLNMQKPDYEALQAAAQKAGEPINTYIKKAIRLRIESEAHN